MKERIDEVADLMDEFRLLEGKLEGDGWKIAFRRRAPKAPAAPMSEASDPLWLEEEGDDDPTPAKDQGPAGIPISSPMNGIFYSSPSPSAPPFVKEGESVTAGQVIGLIEAMKVFNEITAPTSGRVSKYVAQNGQLVQPGEPLLYIE